jgi:hypothetical protein
LAFILIEERRKKGGREKRKEGEKEGRKKTRQKFFVPVMQKIKIWRVK